MTPCNSLKESISRAFKKQTADSSTLVSITKSNSKVKKVQCNHQLNRRAQYALKDTSAKILQSPRLAACLKCRVTADRGIDVKLNKKTSRAGFGNLIRCDSLWICPCCHARVMAKRGTEVEKAGNEWVENRGNHTQMMTLTHRHTRDDNLKQSLLKMGEAEKRLYNDRQMRQIWQQIGKVGSIKALETTHSNANGWHPHVHSVLFLEQDIDFLGKYIAVTSEKDEKGDVIDGSLLYVTPTREKRLIKKGLDGDIEFVTFETFVKHYWVKLCREVGLGIPTLENGVHFQSAEFLKTYLTKFKTAQELTNSQSKKGNGSSRNQWEILADAHVGDAHAAKLWQTYAAAFKGERQLFWSRGLKKLLLIDDVDDSEIVELEGIAEEEVAVVAEIVVEDWSYICRKNWRTDLLDIVENDYKNGTDNLFIFLYSVKKLAAIEREKWERKRQERIANLRPQQWFNDHHNADCA